jgi:hypothetical protein
MEGEGRCGSSPGLSDSLRLKESSHKEISGPIEKCLLRLSFPTSVYDHHRPNLTERLIDGLAQIRVTRSTLGAVNAKRTVRHSLSFEAIISAHDGVGLWRGGARQRLLDFSYLTIAIVCEMPVGALADPGDSWNETRFEDVGGPA